MPHNKANSDPEQHIKKILDRFRRELLGEVQTVLGTDATKLKETIARKSWQVAQKWCKWENDGPVLMPDYTRFYYRKGDVEILVQEFPPQARYLKFSGNLMDEHVDSVRSYSLAMPFVIFAHRFSKGLADETWVSFSDRPLKNFKETPYKPYLSNIDTDLHLCHGTAYSVSDLIVGNLAQQAAYIVSLFWQTTFTAEWSSNFTDYQKYFKTDGHRMATLAGWEEASNEDPLFVIDEVNWLESPYIDFGTMIVKLIGDCQADTGFRQELYDAFIEKYVGEFKTMIESCGDIALERTIRFAKTLQRPDA
jgi:hypothetical protein